MADEKAGTASSDAGTKDAKAAEGAAKTPETLAAEKTAADAKAAADKTAADTAAAAKAKETTDASEASKAPAAYTLKVPDGAGDWLDDTDLKAVEKLARDKGLSNDAAQTFVNEHADALAAQSASFRAITEKDESYGGEKLVETQRLAQLALDKIRPAGTPRGDALRKLLSKTGYGNHLEVVSLLADLGKQMAEDAPGKGGTGGGGGGSTTKDPAAVLYDKSPAA